VLEIEMALKESAVEDYTPFIHQFEAAINEFISTAGRVEVKLAEKLDETAGEPPARVDSTG
jgi:hypothetical protein